MGGFSLKRAKEYFKGYVVAEIRGKNPERLVNLCLSSGFPVWDFTVTGQKATFSTSLSKYMQIRPLARRARCVPRVIKRVGLPFFIKKATKRPFMVWACMLLLAAIVFLSGFVWSIKILGAEQVEPEEILKVAQDNGLSIGIRRSNIPKDIDAAIAEQIPQLSWAYVHCQGTRAVIEVAEKSHPETIGPGDLVASKDGVVETILVLSGVPVVQAGDTVKRGTLLIAGDESGSIKGARGTVTAYTFYETRVEIPLERLIPKRTGNTLKVTLLRFHRADEEVQDNIASYREWILSGRRTMFEWYEIEDYPSWEIQLPKGRELQSIQRTYYEVQWSRVILGRKEAEALAEKQAKDSMERLLPSSAELIDLNCEVVPTDGQSVSVRIRASALEDITEVRQWSGQNTEVDK